MKTSTIQVNYGKITLKPENIKYIESVFGNYSKIHLTHGQSILTAFTLKHYTTQLKSERFQHARKGLLINLDMMKTFKVESDQKYVVLKTGESFRLSRRKGKELMALVG